MVARLLNIRLRGPAPADYGPLPLLNAAFTSLLIKTHHVSFPKLIPHLLVAVCVAC